MKELSTKRFGQYSNFFVYVGLFFIFFGCTNIFSLQGYSIVFGALMIYISCFLKGAFKPNRHFWLLVCFCLSYAVFSFLSGEKKLNSFVSAIAYSVFVPISIGLSILQDPKNIKLRKGLIWSMAVGLAFSSVLTVLATYIYTGSNLSDVLITFWSDDGMARTGIQLYFIPLFSLSFAYFWKLKRNLHRKDYWFGFIGLLFYDVFVFYFSMEIGNRAIFISFAAIFVYAVIRLINAAKSRIFRISCYIVLALIVLVIIGLFFGILPVPEFLANIPVIERFLNGGSNSQRLSLYIEFLQNFWRYPFGGVFVEITDTYVHNFLLDIYSFGGILPFAFFIILLICYICHFRRINSEYSLGDLNKFLFVGVFSLGMFEPLFIANPLYISVFVLLFADCLAVREILYCPSGRSLYLRCRI